MLGDVFRQVDHRLVVRLGLMVRNRGLPSVENTADMVGASIGGESDITNPSQPGHGTKKIPEGGMITFSPVGVSIVISPTTWYTVTQPASVKMA